MLEMPEITNKLTGVDRQIFVASTKVPISDLSDQEMVTKAATLFKLIALDVGYKIPMDKTEWAYICTRLSDALKRYYGKLSITEIKLAFELLVVGELDSYLPKGRDGQADREHYQAFNLDYFSKVLSAYNARRNGVLTDVHKSMPKPKETISDTEKEAAERRLLEKIRNIYNGYCETGRLPVLNDIEVMLVCNYLIANGYMEDIKISDADKAEALRRVMYNCNNEMKCADIRKAGIAHESVEQNARFKIRREMLLESFQKMREKNIKI